MLAVTGIPTVDCATGTCVPCSCRSHSRRTFSSRRRCTFKGRSQSQEFGIRIFHTPPSLPYLLLPDSSISIKGSSDNLRPCPSGTNAEYPCPFFASVQECGNRPLAPGGSAPTCCRSVGSCFLSASG